MEKNNVFNIFYYGTFVLSLILSGFTIYAFNWYANPSDFMTIMLYLFSTLAQSQAAFGGIIISLTVIGMQLISEKYTTKLIDILLESKLFWLIISTYTFSILFDISMITIIPTSPYAVLSYSIFDLNNVLLFIGFFMLYLNLLLIFHYLKFTIGCLKPKILISYLCNTLTHDKINEKLKKEEYIFDHLEQLFKKIMHEESVNNFNFLLEYFFNEWYCVAEKNIYDDITVDKKYYFSLNYNFFLFCVSLANYAVKTKNKEYLMNILICINKIFKKMNDRLDWNFEYGNHFEEFITDVSFEIEKLYEYIESSVEKNFLHYIMYDIFIMGLNSVTTGKIKTAEINLEYIIHVFFETMDNDIIFTQYINKLALEMIDLIPKNSKNKIFNVVLQDISWNIFYKLEDLFSENMSSKIFLYRNLVNQIFKFYMIAILLQEYNESTERYIDTYILPLNKFLTHPYLKYMLKKLEKNKKFTFLKSGEVIEFSILQHYDNFEKIKSYMDSELDKQQLERIEMWKSNINKRDNLFNMDDEGNFK